jgi:hypothetical protein
VPDGPRPAGPPALPPRGGPHNDGAEEDTEVVTVTNARPGTVAVQTLGEGMASRPLLCPFDMGGRDLVRRGGRVFQVRIDDHASLASGVGVRGAWRLGVDDDPAVVRGTWTARRSGAVALGAQGRPAHQSYRRLTA